MRRSTYEPDCRPGQTIKLSCPGNYRINSYFLALSLTYHGNPIAARRPAEPRRDERRRAPSGDRRRGGR